MLIIKDLRARAVRVPLTKPHPTASGTLLEASLVLVDLLANEDVTGCSYVFCYTPLALKPVEQLIQNLGPVIAGCPLEPYTIERLLQGRFRLLGSQGLTGIAIAAIDMAAWDALAKSAGLPLVRLLGGSPVPIPAYDSVGLGGIEQGEREAGEAAAAGFRAIKYKIGYPDVATEVELVRAAKRAGGGALKIMVDYNQSLSVPEAIARGGVIDEEAIEWIEEPTIADDIAGHAKIAASVATPIQLGENWWGTHDMVKSVEAGASDYVMTDLMKIGGVTGWLRAAAIAEPKGLRISSHLFPEMSVHLMAVTPGAHWLEWLDLASPILAEPLRIVEGNATASDKPGGGIAWNEEAVSRFLVQ